MTDRFDRPQGSHGCACDPSQQCGIGRFLASHYVPEGSATWPSQGDARRSLVGGQECDIAFPQRRFTNFELFVDPLPHAGVIVPPTAIAVNGGDGLVWSVPRLGLFGGLTHPGLGAHPGTEGQVDVSTTVSPFRSCTSDGTAVVTGSLGAIRLRTLARSLLDRALFSRLMTPEKQRSACQAARPCVDWRPVHVHRRDP